MKKGEADKRAPTGGDPDSRLPSKRELVEAGFNVDTVSEFDETREVVIRPVELEQLATNIAETRLKEDYMTKGRVQAELEWAKSMLPLITPMVRNNKKNRGTIIHLKATMAEFQGNDEWYEREFKTPATAKVAIIEGLIEQTYDEISKKPDLTLTEFLDAVEWKIRAFASKFQHGIGYSSFL